VWFAGSQKVGEFKRGSAPLRNSFPLSFEGEGDTGGEVDKKQANQRQEEV